MPAQARTVKPEPFELSILRIVRGLSDKWQPVGELTEPDEKAIDRLILGGFIEAKQSITLAVPGTRKKYPLTCGVFGNYPDDLARQAAVYLSTVGHDVVPRIHYGAFTAARLTGNGLVAQRWFSHQPVMRDRLLIVSRGFTVKGKAVFETETADPKGDGVIYSAPQTMKFWTKAFDKSERTLRAWFKPDGNIKAKKVGGSYKVELREVPEAHRDKAAEPGN